MLENMGELHQQCYENHGLLIKLALEENKDREQNFRGTRKNILILKNALLPRFLITECLSIYLPFSHLFLT